jgi:hypothetical protein
LASFTTPSATNLPTSRASKHHPTAIEAQVMKENEFINLLMYSRSNEHLKKQNFQAAPLGATVAHKKISKTDAGSSM